jgi:hypothetical protein
MKIQTKHTIIKPDEQEVQTAQQLHVREQKACTKRTCGKKDNTNVAMTT